MPKTNCNNNEILGSESFTPKLQCTEVRFAIFLSISFITAIVVNPQAWKLAKRTSVQWVNLHHNENATNQGY